MTFLRTPLVSIMLCAALGPLAACSGGSDASGDGDTGRVGMELQIAPGVTVNTVTWTISNTGTGFSRNGTVNVQHSNTVRFQTGGIPTATGYTISLLATSTDGTFTCSGAANFDISRGASTSVTVNLTCYATPNGSGTAVVSGATQVCANLDSISAAPLETAVNSSINLSATASAGTVTPTYAWSATAGTFDSASSQNPVFTCPAAAGDVTITVNVFPSSSACPTVTSQSITVTCDTLQPTFTNVYASILGVRCVGCHKPGSGGVTTGMLDMSSQATAYANLVGIVSQGTSAGSAGVTCTAAALPRVTPNDSANSLLYNKVNSKLLGTTPPCGSPMPLGSGAALSADQIDLIRAWIDGGALNN